MRDQFVKNRRELKNITAQQLDIDKPESVKIYINESLTKRNKELFHFVRERKKEKNWQFAWTRNGMIFARKSKDTNLVKINDVKEIEQKIL
eukprot:gene10550-11668_t